MNLVRRFQPDASAPWIDVFLGPALFGLVFSVGSWLLVGPASEELLGGAVGTAVRLFLVVAAFQAAAPYLGRTFRWGLRSLSTEKVLEGSVGRTVAERRWLRRHPDDPGPSELEPEARYRFEFLGDAGEEFVCEVPAWIWKNLQEGDRVRLVAKGLDLLEVVETEDRNGG